MCELCNQPLNTTEIAKNKSRGSLTPSLLNKERFLGWSKITNC